MKTLCKNCNQNFEANYCNYCGQRKIGNKRLHMKEVFLDFLDNTFNLDKGFFFSLWNLLIRPGKVAQAYIDGQRKAYINPTRYMVIGLAFQTFIDYWFKTTEVIENETYYRFSFLSDAMNSSIELWNVKLAVEYILLSNLFMIVFIPFLLYFAYKPLKYNYTELLSASFYYIPTILFITMPILFFTKVVMGVFVSKEVIILLFIGYIFWSFLSLFKKMSFLNRFIRLLIAIGVFMLIRIAFLPFILSYIYPLTS